MGQHYLPQYYLRGFSPDFGQLIWVYDKKKVSKICTQIKSVGNETKLYSDDLETHLANEIEAPANVVLDKIRSYELLTQIEKETLSRYLFILWKRVPEARKRFYSHVPSVLPEVERDVHSKIDQLVSEKPELADLGEKRKMEVSTVLEGFINTPPKDIWHRAIAADANPGAVTKALSEMMWLFMCGEGRGSFLTCDNPVFFFSDIGIGNADSELTFPISSDIALFATRRKDLEEGYFSASKAIVNEVNRRTAFNSSRFVYSHQDKEWIIKFVTKGSWKLNRL